MRFRAVSQEVGSLGGAYRIHCKPSAEATPRIYSRALGSSSTILLRQSLTRRFPPPIQGFAGTISFRLLQPHTTRDSSPTRSNEPKSKPPAEDEEADSDADEGF